MSQIELSSATPPPPSDPPRNDHVIEQLKKMNQSLREEIQQINLEMDQLLIDKEVKMSKTSEFWREKYTRMMLRCLHRERSTDWFCSKLFLRNNETNEE